jgi:hypothetical protein
VTRAVNLQRLFPRLFGGAPDTAASERVLDAAVSEFVDAVARVAEDVPLRLWIDDAQWSDGPSLAFIDALARRRPRGVSVWVTRRPGPPVVPVDHSLTLGPLSEDAVAAWARASGAGQVPVERVPILLTMRFDEGFVEQADADPIQAKIRSLGAPDRALLERVSFAAAPLEWAHLYGDPLATPRQVERLLQARLISLVASHEGTSAIGPAHDLVRAEVLRTATDAEAHHLALADAFERAGSAVELVAHHLTEGRAPTAPEWWARAVDDCFARSAWEGVIEWARRREQSGQGDPVNRERLAIALYRSGRTHEAAEAWLEAAGADVPMVVQARALVEAATIRFGIGDVEGGLSAVQPVADRLGIRLPRSRLGVVVQTAIWTLAHRWDRWRRRSWRPPTETEVSRLAIGWSVAGSLGSLEGTLGVGLNARFTCEAARFGTSLHQAQARCLAATYELGPGPAHPRTEATVSSFDAEISASRPEVERALLSWGIAYGLFMTGEMALAAPRMQAAADGFSRVRFGGWERDHALRHIPWIARYQGLFDAMRSSADAALRRSDVQGTTHEHQIRSGILAFAHLLDDDPVACAAELDAVRRETAQRPVFGTNYLIHHTDMFRALYVGEVGEVERAVPAMFRTDFHLRFLLLGRLEGALHLALAAWLRGTRPRSGRPPARCRESRPAGAARPPRPSRRRTSPCRVGRPRRSRRPTTQRPTASTRSA